MANGSIRREKGCIEGCNAKEQLLMLSVHSSSAFVFSFFSFLFPFFCFIFGPPLILAQMDGEDKRGTRRT